MDAQKSQSAIAAESELEDKLQALGTALESLSEEEKEYVRPLADPLVRLEEASRKEDGDAHLRALVDLAGQIIEIRRAHREGPLSTLPVPPYDLWLPFKARSQYSEKPAALGSEGPVYNKKVLLAVSRCKEILPESPAKPHASS